MPTFKTTFIFESCACGWSETLYGSADDRTQAKNKAIVVAPLRSKLLGQGAALKYARIHAVDTPRDCGLFSFAPMLVNLQPADVAWNGWITRLSGGSHCRNLVLRGMPDAWIERNVQQLCEFPIPGELDTAHTLWCNAVKAQGYQIRFVKTTGGGTAPIPIATLDEDATTGNIKLGIPGLVGVPGDQVRMKLWSGPDKNTLNGLFTIDSNDGTFVIIRKKYADLINPVLDFPGQALAQIKDYANITDCTLVRPGKRATGRPFGLCRGRRRVRR